MSSRMYSYWPRCVRAARGGALEISISPLKAVHISRIKKIAPDVSIADESTHSSGFAIDAPNGRGQRPAPEACSTGMTCGR
jgi:hypothetical protein